MRRSDLTSAAARGRAGQGEAGAQPQADAPGGAARRCLAALLLGALLLALAAQVPAAHTVDIGGRDAAYVQGLYDPLLSAAPGAPDYLAGSDGSARWTGPQAALLFPQAGLPAQVELRLRGWRAEGPLPQVAVWLNGRHELGRFQAPDTWQTYRFDIRAGLAKPSDVVIELRAETAPLSAADPRPVGVLLDRAAYATGPPPLLPYPAQLAYGGLACAMLALLLRRWRPLLAACVALALAWGLLARQQPPLAYPLRGLLPLADLALAGALVWRYGPALARRLPALPDLLALGGLAAWLLFVLAQDHVTLALPGVENDFGVFARRSAHLLAAFQPSGRYPTELDGVFRADGFYNLGYPLLLWLLRPLAGGSAFLAAQWLSALSGALLLLACWWLARGLLGRGPAALALLALASSPLVVQYALYVGTDMLFAALCTLALALLLRAPTARWALAAAGLVGGAAFLVRHPGLLLLPLGWLAVALAARGDGQAPGRPSIRARLLVFTLAFGLAVLPQVAVNLAQTGEPLYSRQAKNIWLAVFAAGDWRRWDEVPDTISLAAVVGQDPARFLANWWANLRAYVGTGGEDTSEFGRAIQLRLLAFPANWLALGGLLGWAALALRLRAPPQEPGARSQEPGSVSLWNAGNLRHPGAAFSADALEAARSQQDPQVPPGAGLKPDAVGVLLMWLASYALFVSVGLALPRFYLPLAPLYALAAAWAALRLARGSPRGLLAAAMLLLALLWGGPATGARYVLDGQDADQVAAVRLVSATLAPGERLIVAGAPDDPLGEYSAIAHLALPAARPLSDTALGQSGAAYLLWSPAAGTPPAGLTPVGQAGAYTLYRIAQ